MRDQPHLLGIGDDHAVDVRRKHLDDGCSVAGRLDDDMIVVRELRPGERLEAFA